MKHGKRPTVQQCKFMQAHGLDSAKWLVVKDTPTEMQVVHRLVNREKRTIPKD